MIQIQSIHTLCQYNEKHTKLIWFPLVAENSTQPFTHWQLKSQHNGQWDEDKLATKIEEKLECYVKFELFGYVQKIPKKYSLECAWKFTLKAFQNENCRKVENIEKINF